MQKKSIRGVTNQMDKLVFIIDDTDSVLTLCASLLEDEYRVLTIPSAEKMFSLLEKIKPDMIVMDIEMPEMNGFEAIAKLKENPDLCGIPVLFMTGYVDETVRSRVEELGAFGIIDKEDIGEGLLDRVNRSLLITPY